MFKVTEKVTGITCVSQVHFSVLNKTLIYHARNEAEEMKVQMAHPKKKKNQKKKHDLPLHTFNQSFIYMSRSTPVPSSF